MRKPSCERMIVMLGLFLLHFGHAHCAWTGLTPRPPATIKHAAFELTGVAASDQRRKSLIALVTSSTGLVCNSFGFPPPVALAYTPDSDPLRESLYLMSRVQEATVQQERFATNSKLQEEMQRKMKLSLRLVDKSYRLLDQINYASQFVQPAEELVTATEAGYEAADALQGAIDFVNKDLGDGPVTDQQREFLIEAMQTTRNELFVFLKFMPTDRLAEARLRVEQENVDNRDEFAGSDDAGLFNPVKLPWK